MKLFGSGKGRKAAKTPAVKEKNLMLVGYGTERSAFAGRFIYFADPIYFYAKQDDGTMESLSHVAICNEMLSSNIKSSREILEWLHEWYFAVCKHNELPPMNAPAYVHGGIITEEQTSDEPQTPEISAIESHNTESEPQIDAYGDFVAPEDVIEGFPEPTPEEIIYEQPIPEPPTETYIEPVMYDAPEPQPILPMTEIPEVTSVVAEVSSDELIFTQSVAPEAPETIPETTSSIESDFDALGLTAAAAEPELVWQETPEVHDDKEASLKKSLEGALQQNEGNYSIPVVGGITPNPHMQQDDMPVSGLVLSDESPEPLVEIKESQDQQSWPWDSQVADVEN